MWPDDTYPRIFWEDRKHQQIRLAQGMRHTYFSLPDLGPEQEVPLFGVFPFFDHPLSKSVWNILPSPPLLEPKKVWTLSSKDLDSPSTIPFYPPYQRTDVPNQSTWEHMVKKTLEKIREGICRKMVLARETALTFAKPLDPWSILHHLRKTASGCVTLFCYQPSPSCAFLGATPEKLFERQGRLLFTMALAGTRPRGSTQAEDLYLEQQLRESQKDGREIEHVRAFLRDSLSHLCSNIVQSESVDIMKTSSVQHLLYRFQGLLKDAMSDRDILLKLHPTPALGGYPQDVALAELRQLEPFDRGRYGAPLGWFSQKTTDVAVGIRSALIESNRLHLFAGTGIVEGSQHEQEWEELEHKIQPFIKLCNFI